MLESLGTLGTTTGILITLLSRNKTKSNKR